MSGSWLRRPRQERQAPMECKVTRARGSVNNNGDGRLGASNGNVSRSSINKLRYEA